ncbi:hypothetical protein Enr10x_49030 [Gimesia panareensis]|uniref:Uncharacterized protein n=1 Tax=Gimesia panareensis TaxID=2527978 RepID=A0A517QD41_9PLAN|nr:hypothetical protein [Gimesia panareensis]QDT29548.1 hypothetical protein Enr10x_49030 [Gimesia panareensis]
MKSIRVRSGLAVLTVLLVSGLGSVARGQFKARAATKGSGSVGGAVFSDGLLNYLFLDSKSSIQQGVSPGYVYVSQSSWRGRRFSFLCVVEHTYEGNEEDHFHSQMQTLNSQGMVSQWFLIKDAICRLKYDLDTHPQKQLTETMRFGIREVDLQQGRVFYIDLRRSPARVTQLPLQLPKSLGQEKDDELIKAAIQNWQANGNLTHQGKSFLFEAGPVAARKPREEDLWPDEIEVEETE